MKFGKETKKVYCQFEFEFEDKEFQMLREYGLKEIAKDDNALVNYAINKILANCVNTSVKRRIKK